MAKSVLYNIFKDFIFQFPEDQNELHRINYLLDFCFNCCSLLSTEFKEREGELKSLTSYLFFEYFLGILHKIFN